MRRFVIDNALMWLRDYHCDGLRLDAVHAIVDDSATHILRGARRPRWTRWPPTFGRPLFLIAESDLNDPRLVRSRDAGGYGLDAAWADEWHHALHATLTGDASRLLRGLRAAARCWPRRCARRGCTTAPTPPTASGCTAGRRRAWPARQFVVCTQNHDQVGNRALGERSSALMSDGRLRVAAALLLTSPFVPMLFQGEEWGASTPFQYFTDHQRSRARPGGQRRAAPEFAAFGWDPADVPDPQDPATFERSRLDWAEPRKDRHADLLAWYRELIALRAGRARRSPIPGSTASRPNTTSKSAG